MDIVRTKLACFNIATTWPSSRGFRAGALRATGRGRVQYARTEKIEERDVELAREAERYLEKFLLEFPCYFNLTYTEDDEVEEGETTRTAPPTG